MRSPLSRIDGASSRFDVGWPEVDRERLSEMLGLNVPTHIAYVRWVSGILLRGTLGRPPADVKMMCSCEETLGLPRGAVP